MKGLDRRALLMAMALASGTAMPLHAQSLDLEALMRRMAARKSGQARFTEERVVGGIDGPLRSSGTLSFAAPDRFERRNLQPVQETMLIQGRTLVLRRGTRTRQMDVDAVPELGALLEALRGTLTGDAARLQQHFRTQLTGTDAKWVLLLEPLDARLRQQLAQIEVVGRAIDVHSIALQMRGGDRSLMLLEPMADAAETIDAKR
ncbi:MAG: outer membrane lipoprotein carrier protein LolA [Burkholderiales bacterium]|nr:outer membrane lipoprotein carrier protein LolA [Burkholderiales bacterium]